MTAQEIINIFEEAGVEVESFAYGEDFVPKDFEPSEEVQREIERKKEALDQFKTVQSDPSNNKEEVDKWRKAYYAIPSSWEIIENEWLESVGIGPMVEVEQVGGEGEGDLWYSVKHFPKHDVYIKTTGHYSSYAGVEFYDGYGEEVFPQKKTVTVYETRKPK